MGYLCSRAITAQITLQLHQVEEPVQACFIIEMCSWWEEALNNNVCVYMIIKLTLLLLYSAPVQQWDHHIKDGYKRSYDDNATSRLSSSWDGKRSSSSNVVEELNQSSMRAYGPASKLC